MRRLLLYGGFEERVADEAEREDCDCEGIAGGVVAAAE